MQMVMEKVLAQKSKGSPIWITQVININKYGSVNAAEPGNSSGKMPQLSFAFSVKMKIFVEFFSSKF